MKDDDENEIVEYRGPGVSRSNIERYFDEKGNWRLRVLTGQKFDEVRRAIYLREMAEHGRKTTACIAAGISMTTANWAIDHDPDFNEAVAHAMLAYKDRLIAHHQNLVFNGIEKNRYDSKGNLIETSVEYPIRLIELELKKHDEGYRDKRDVNMNVSGGVVVAPAEMSIEDWEKKHGKTIDGEYTKVHSSRGNEGPVEEADE